MTFLPIGSVTLLLNILQPDDPQPVHQPHELVSSINLKPFYRIVGPSGMFVVIIMISLTGKEKINRNNVFGRIGHFIVLIPE
jgi:hypothetical protein